MTLILVEILKMLFMDTVKMLIVLVLFNKNYIIEETRSMKN